MRKKYPVKYMYMALVMFILMICAGERYPGGDLPALKGLAILLFLPALVFMFFPFWQMGRYGEAVDGMRCMESLQLVERGLFSIVRHPQYVGYMMLALGFILLNQNVLSLIFGAGMIVFLFLQIREEELSCIEYYGDAYRRYMEKVPRVNWIKGWILWGAGKRGRAD